MAGVWDTKPGSQGVVKCLVLLGKGQSVQQRRYAAQIDYINLTYTCSGMDVYEMREFLDDNDGANIKIIAKVGPTALTPVSGSHRCPEQQHAYSSHASVTERLL